MMDEIVSMKPLIKINIKDIVERLEENKKYHLEIQDELREYVTNKEFAIEDRFEVWSKYCDKVHHPWVIHESNVPVIGKWVEELLWYIEEQRYNTFDWEWFYNNVEEALSWTEGEYVSDSEEKVREDIKSLDEFKEILIETNFGSFVFDW